MSDSSNPFGFGKLVPGFDFLQNLMEQAGKTSGRSGAPGLPGMSNWIAPTLNVEELERRISELKAVSFWLDQNAKAVSATVQALEVQKMTLATLAGMNVAMADVAKAFQVKAPAASAASGRKRPADASASAYEGWPHSPEADAPLKAAGNPYQKSFQSHSEAEPAAPPPAAEPQARSEAPAAGAAKGSAQPSPDNAPAGGGSVIDPMQWWGALTHQFQQIAANAMRDVGSANPALAASREMAGAAMKNANRMAATMAGSGRAAAKKSKSAPGKTGSTAGKKATAGSRKTATKHASSRK